MMPPLLTPGDESRSFFVCHALFGLRRQLPQYKPRPTLTFSVEHIGARRCVKSLDQLVVALGKNCKEKLIEKFG